MPLNAMNTNSRPRSLPSLLPLPSSCFCLGDSNGRAPPRERGMAMECKGEGHCSTGTLAAACTVATVRDRVFPLLVLVAGPSWAFWAKVRGLGCLPFVEKPLSKCCSFYFLFGHSLNSIILSQINLEYYRSAHVLI